MASFSQNAFLTDAFSNQAFDFGTPTPVTTTTGGHFAGRKRKKYYEEDVTESARARERLRATIIEAVEGPKAEVAQTVLSAYIAPQDADSLYLPLLQRINWSKIDSNIDQIVAELARAIEDDDDEDTLLLFS